MAKISLNSSMENKKEITEFTKNIISVAADNSKNPTIIINSGRRSPERQAEAMYSNLSRGINIAYKSPGKQVTTVYENNKSKQKKIVIQLMVDKINELSKKGLRVSLHCVDEETYSKLNIIDISKNIPNPRDFAIEMLKNLSVTKIITPFTSKNYSKDDISTHRLLIDKSEPAIHCEIKQN